MSAERPNVQGQSWYTLAFPEGTPPEVRSDMERVIREGLEAPGVMDEIWRKASLAAMGYTDEEHA